MGNKAEAALREILNRARVVQDAPKQDKPGELPGGSQLGKLEQASDFLDWLNNEGIAIGEAALKE